jgi:hypothetical protein
MTKAESIKNRTMSKNEIAKLEALAKKQEGNYGASETLKDIPPAPTATEQALPVDGPKTVEALVTHYYNTYGMKYPAEIAASLTQAAIYLEGAAMVTKALKAK